MGPLHCSGTCSHVFQQVQCLIYKHTSFFYKNCIDKIDLQLLRIYFIPLHRVVTKISSCRINTTSRRGIKRLGISFGSIFLLFSNKSSLGSLSQQPGKIPGPRLLMTTLNTALHFISPFINLALLFQKPCIAAPGFVQITLS